VPNREGSLPGEDRGGSREEVVCCPSLDSMPEAIHASECIGVQGEEVCPIGEYREAEALGDAVT